MQMSIPQYNPRVTKKSGLQGIQIQEIQEEVERYLTYYRDCYDRPSLQRYAKAFIQGLLSNPDRKSIEPIALRLLEDQDVRGMQHFFKRSTLPETMLPDRYQKILSEQIGQQGGMLSVDETDFVK